MRNLKRGLIFSLEVILVLLSSAALLYSIQVQAQPASLAAWRAALLAQDIAQAFAYKSLQGEEASEQISKELVDYSQKLAKYCVKISYKSLERQTQGKECKTNGNEILATRTIFDGSSFGQVAVSVRYN